MECGGGAPVAPVTSVTSLSKTHETHDITQTGQTSQTSQTSHANHSHQRHLDGLCPRPARRKLRKCAPNPKTLSTNKRRSQDSIASGSLECGGRLATPQSSNCERPSIPMPPDLGDSKWLDYIERSGLMSSPDLNLSLGSGAKAVTEPPQFIIPEFSRLSLNRPSSRSSPDDNSSSLRPPVMNRPRKSLTKRSLMVPPFKIGQLDGTAPRKKEIRVIKRRASIELIAEQYQAFLESRDAENEEESDYEGKLDDNARLESTQFDPALDQPREVLLDALRPEPNNLSPASDGTLVAFEEDVIYFKPVSFSSPEPSPRPERQSFDKPLPRPPSDPGNQPLQTCIAMLVKELTNAMPRQAPGDSSQALQISVMIEAYERLRDQAVTTGMGELEQRNVRSMFDCWLAALHTMHRSHSRGSQVNERQCQELAEDVD